MYDYYTCLYGTHVVAWATLISILTANQETASTNRSYVPPDDEVLVKDISTNEVQQVIDYEILKDLKVSHKNENQQLIVDILQITIVIIVVVVVISALGYIIGRPICAKLKSQYRQELLEKHQIRTSTKQGKSHADQTILDDQDAALGTGHGAAAQETGHGAAAQGTVQGAAAQGTVHGAEAPGATQGAAHEAAHGAAAARAQGARQETAQVATQRATQRTARKTTQKTVGANPSHVKEAKTAGKLTTQAQPK